MFNPLSYFSNLGSFIDTLRNLNARHKVTPDATRIESFCFSVALKYYSAETHLQNILSIKEWDLPIPSSPSTTSGPVSSGTTITTGSPSNYIPYALTNIQQQTVKISNNLDDFFSNIFSAHDVFAHVLNFVYLSRPTPNNNVYFHTVAGAISALPHPRDSIKTLLDGCLGASLYKDAKKYRRTTTHDNASYFHVLPEIDPFASTQSPAKLLAILIADDPKVTPLTFVERRDFISFGPRVLRHTQAVINSAYGIMERTIRTVDTIPI